MLKIDWKTCFRVGVSIFLLYLALSYWQVAARFVSVALGAALPLFVGCAIAYIVNILMSLYEKYYFPKKSSGPLAKSRRPVCMIAAMVSVLAIIFLIARLIVPQLVSCIRLLVSEIPGLVEKILANKDILNSLPESVTQFLSQLDTKNLLDKALNFFTSGIGDVLGFSFSLVTTVFSVTVTVLLSVIFAIYILLGKDRLSCQINRVTRAFLRDSMRKKLHYNLAIVDDCFRKYIVGQCTEAVILGALCTVGMLIFRFPYAAMIGTLIGFTALIPVAGAYIGAGIGAFMILTVSPVKALLFLVYIIVLQQLEGNIIYPRVVGTSVGLPAIWVLAAVTVGGSLMGVTGMLLGVPVAAAVYRILEDAVESREAALAGNHLNEELVPATPTQDAPDDMEDIPPDDENK